MVLEYPAASFPLDTQTVLLEDNLKQDPQAANMELVVVSLAPKMDIDKLFPLRLPLMDIQHPDMLIVLGIDSNNQFRPV